MLIKKLKTLLCITLSIGNYRSSWHIMKPLRILGRGYNFPKLVGFLSSKLKYLISLTVKKPLFLRLLNISLLASENLLIIYLVLLTSLYTFVSLNIFQLLVSNRFCSIQLHQILYLLFSSQYFYRRSKI